MTINELQTPVNTGQLYSLLPEQNSADVIEPLEQLLGLRGIDHRQ